MCAHHFQKVSWWAVLETTLKTKHIAAVIPDRRKKKKSNFSTSEIHLEQNLWIQIYCGMVKSLIEQASKNQNRNS